MGLLVLAAWVGRLFLSWASLFGALFFGGRVCPRLGWRGGMAGLGWFLGSFLSRILVRFWPPLSVVRLQRVLRTVGGAAGAGLGPQGVCCPKVCCQVWAHVAVCLSSVLGFPCCVSPLV